MESVLVVHCVTNVQVRGGGGRQLHTSLACAEIEKERERERDKDGDTGVSKNVTHVQLSPTSKRASTRSIS